MSPQWIPQNIQKRLLLYVLQQLSLFSEIDLPNLEEVSLNNITLKDVNIDPEKVGKLPFCNLRYGQVGTLELNGGVMEGVVIDAKDIDLVIAPNANYDDLEKDNGGFLLAQSRADLANTMMDGSLDDEAADADSMEKSTDLPDDSKLLEKALPEESGRPKLSAFSNMMTKAVEMALLRLQVNLSNLKIKMVSELTDIVFHIEKGKFGTQNGLRNLVFEKAHIYSLRPHVNLGRFSDKTQSSTELDKSDESKDSSEDESDDSSTTYGEESLMKSTVFTHEEASSIYMSAISQQSDLARHNAVLGKNNESKAYLAHVDIIELGFEGLSDIFNLSVHIGDVKIAYAPLIPVLVSALASFTRLFKLKNLRKRKQRSSNQLNKYNPRFPQYTYEDAIDDDEVSQEDSKDPNDPEPKFNSLHISNIIISFTSALLPSGDFAASDHIFLKISNSNIKHRDSNLVFGGIERIKLLEMKDEVEKVIFEYCNDAPKTTPNTTSSENAYQNQNLSKADFRFEIVKNEGPEEPTEIIILLSKQANIILELHQVSLLTDSVKATIVLYQAYTTLQTTLDSYFEPTKKGTSSFQKPLKKSASKSQVVLQTAAVNFLLSTGNDVSLKINLLPISYNKLQNLLMLNKILFCISSKSQDDQICTISNVKLSTKRQEFKMYSNGVVQGTNVTDGSVILTLISSSTLFLGSISGKLTGDETYLLNCIISRLSNAISDIPMPQYEAAKSFQLKHDSTPNGDFSNLLQNSILNHRRPPNLHSFNTPTFMKNSKANHINSVSFRVLVLNINFEVIDTKSLMGLINLLVNDLSFHFKNDDMNGYVRYFNLGRLGEDKVYEDFVHEIRKNPINPDFPLVTFGMKKDDSLVAVDISIKTIAFEYYANWLKLIEPKNENDCNNVDKVDTSITKKPKGTQRKITFRINLQDCIVGLNPGRLKCKIYLSSNKGRFDAVVSSGVFDFKGSLRQISLFIIDDISYVTQDLAGKGTGKSELKYVTSSEWLLGQGYTSIGSLNSMHIGITVSEAERKFTTLKINSDESHLDLCADSTHVLIQMLNDLKPPISYIEDQRSKVHLDSEINLLDDILEDFYAFKKRGSQSGSNNTERKSTEDSYSLSKRTTSSEVNQESPPNDLVEEYYDIAPPSGRNSDLDGSRQSSDTSYDLESEEFVFDETHFMNPQKTNQQDAYPLSIQVVLAKVKIYMYDGFDFKELRKAIKSAVKRLELQALDGIGESQVHTDPLNDPRAVQFGNTETYTSVPDEEYTKSLEEDARENAKDSNADEVPLMSETVFESINLSLPKGTHPSKLTANINNNVQNLANSTDVPTTQDKINCSSTKNYKNLRLRRSKTHKVVLDLKNVDISMALGGKEEPNVSEVSYDGETITSPVVGSIKCMVDDIVIFDNIPTSSWNKVLGYMNLLGEREIGTKMFKVDIKNIKTSPSLQGTEAMIDLSILPVRLYVDQDTLDFIIRFLEFKDQRFDLPMDEIFFIQSFKVDSLRIKLDYKPKKVDISDIKSGKASELINFFVLDGSELSLPKLKTYGILGFSKLMIELKNAWLPVIQDSQLVGILSGLAPVRTVVNIGEGLRDLVAIPVKEYKKDGRLMRSLQKGTSNFMKTTSSELLRLGVKLASGTQVILENSEEVFGGEGSAARLRRTKSQDDNESDVTFISDATSADKGNRNLVTSSKMLNKNTRKYSELYTDKKLYSYVEMDEETPIDGILLDNTLLLEQSAVDDSSDSQYEPVALQIAPEANPQEDVNSDDENAEKVISLYSNQPATTQEGLKLAYKSLGRNFVSAKKTITQLRKEINRSSNFQDSLTSVLKSSPVLIIRPIIGTTEALLKTLMGVSNQIDSNNMLESKDKYRSNDPNISE